MSENSCNINDKGSSCCSSSKPEESINLSEHWNKAYSNNPPEKLGWFETDLSPMLTLISASGIDKSSSILNIGAGSTVLIDELLKDGYTNLIATDISEISLKGLENRNGNEKVKYILDDLTTPKELNNISPVDLWIDRAVLHFLTEAADQNTYFNLLKNKVKSNGFVILAEFNLEGAQKCSGLAVKRYSKEMLANKLGEEFQLIDSFDYSYTMPSGDKRPYIYTLFKRK